MASGSIPIYVRSNVECNVPDIDDRNARILLQSMRM